MEDSLYSYFTGLSPSFDTNAGVNLPAAQATSPVITNADGTSSVSPSFLSQIGSFLTSAAPLATAIVPGITGTAAKTATAAKPAATTAVSSLFSSPMMLIGLIGGAVLFLVLLFRKK
jgi:hypothetical protein